MSFVDPATVVRSCALPICEPGDASHRTRRSMGIVSTGGPLDFISCRSPASASRESEALGEFRRFLSVRRASLGRLAIHKKPLIERRAFLEKNVKGQQLSEITRDVEKAKMWLQRLEVLGLDGIVAKRTDLPYMPGSREAVQKVKNHRTIDCVVVGYRTSGKKIATLLLACTATTLLTLSSHTLASPSLDHYCRTSSLRWSRRKAPSRSIRCGNKGGAGAAHAVRVAVGPPFAISGQAVAGPLQSRLRAVPSRDRFVSSA